MEKVRRISSYEKKIDELEAEVSKKFKISNEKEVYLLFGNVRNIKNENTIIKNFLKFRNENEVLYISHSNYLKNANKGGLFKKIWNRFKILIFKLINTA